MLFFENIKLWPAYLFYLFAVAVYLMQKSCSTELEAKELKGEICLWQDVRNITLKTAIFFFVFLIVAEYAACFCQETIPLFEGFALWLCIYAAVLVFFSPRIGNFYRRDISTADIISFDFLNRSKNLKSDKEDFLAAFQHIWQAIRFSPLLLVCIFATEKAFPCGAWPYYGLGMGYLVLGGLVLLGEYFIGKGFEKRRDFWLATGRVFAIVGGICLFFWGYGCVPYIVLFCLLAFTFAWHMWNDNLDKMQTILALPYVLEAKKKEIETLEHYIQEYKRQRKKGNI